VDVDDVARDAETKSQFLLCGLGEVYE